MGEHQGGALRVLDDAGHRERLAAAGNAKESLVAQPVVQAASQLFDRLGLIAGGNECGVYLEIGHGESRSVDSGKGKGPKGE